MSVLEIHPDNSATVQITLTNPLISPIYVNDATVTATIFNPDGSELVAQFALPYVAASNGIYRQTIIPIAGLVIDETYTIQIDSAGVDSLIGRWISRIMASEASIL